MKVYVFIANSKKATILGLTASNSQVVYQQKWEYFILKIKVKNIGNAFEI